MGLKPMNELMNAMEWESVTLPYMVFKMYRELGINDKEALVVMHIIAFQQVERTFPSLSELEKRMEPDKEQIAAILQHLFANGFIIQAEDRVSIRPLLEKILGIHDNGEKWVSVFTRFEEEFGRLLSPLEYEQITHWLDDDHYPEWIIVEALRESVLAGVFNFRYVDTILREWERANIKTEAQLSEHRQRHKRQAKGRNVNVPVRSTAGGEQKAPSRSGTEERVVPAAQPGKYERFYQVYKKQQS